jgi:threonine dehydrogenase-like Zn-dependent dehydrogenase
VQFAVKSNIHPIIAVAGKSIAHVEQFIDPSKGDTIIDYRNGDDAIVEGIKNALGTSGLHHAFDAVSDKSSINNLRQVLAEGSKLAVVWPSNKEKDVASHIEEKLVFVGSAHKEDADFGYLFSRYLGRGLQQRWFKPQPQKVIPGGLNGIKQGLDDLKNGHANAVKYVFRIAETGGA